MIGGSCLCFVVEMCQKEDVQDPFIPLLKMKAVNREKFLINVSLRQCKRAKQRALYDFEGGLIEHYGRLWEYSVTPLDGAWTKHVFGSVSQEIHGGEQLDSDVDSVIDDHDNTIPYHQYQLNNEVESVPTDVSSVIPGEISVITILDDLRSQLEGHIKTNEEQSFANDSLKAELERYKTHVQNLEQSKVKMDDPNITMEDYIRLEEEKARKRGKVFNWETAKYGKIWYDEERSQLGSVETEFPSIDFNDTLTSEAALSCEPTVSSLNNEIDFRISFDESDDEDYTVIFDKNSFSYKIKTDSENDNEKLMPSIPSPEPPISCFDDLDFFNDFENEFPAIVYNNAQTSKSDLLTEPVLNPQHIDEFDLKSKTSLSKCDEEE
ncbi:hypothetical protein Tco_0563667 [Tanacetum coccineum]